MRVCSFTRLVKLVTSRVSSGLEPYRPGGRNICHLSEDNSIRGRRDSSKGLALAVKQRCDLNSCGRRWYRIMALPNVVFVLGAPGAGKGTQCQKIVQEFGFVHLSAGDLLREERKKGGDVAEEIEGHIKNGTIVPVAITCGLLDKAMQLHMKKENKMNFLIDGFPRNKDNLDGWNQAMCDKAHVKFVLFFEVSTETGVDRALKRGQEGSGRSDDNIESLKKRINTYKEATMSIIEHYQKLDLVRLVDGSPSAEDVYTNVRKLFL